MNNIIFIAPPAAGKGTQSSLLVEKYGFIHISTGDLLRSEVASKTELGKKLEEIMSSGNLVDDSIVTELLRNRLSLKDTNDLKHILTILKPLIDYYESKRIIKRSIIMVLQKIHLNMIEEVIIYT